MNDTVTPEIRRQANELLEKIVVAAIRLDRKGFCVFIDWSGHVEWITVSVRFGREGGAAYNKVAKEWKAYVRDYFYDADCSDDDDAVYWNIAKLERILSEIESYA
jgi:hypothetical protein